MIPEVQDKWERAKSSLDAARHLIPIDPDSAASRAYYAAFHAVSALFLHEGATFTRHTGVEAAVHRDLVKAGRWTADLGQVYRELWTYRAIGDYGSLDHVSQQDALVAVESAEAILAAVARECPGLFHL